MPFCPHCSQTVSEDDIFCAYCGTNIYAAHAISLAKESLNTSWNMNASDIEKYQTLVNKIENLHDIEHYLATEESQLHEQSQLLATAQQKLQELHLQSQKEYKDVEKLKTLTVTALVAGIKGNKNKQLEKEQLEYMDALNKQELVEREVQHLTVLVQQIQYHVNDLKQLVTTKDSLTQELEHLIDKVCEGVPDPVEDQIEEELHSLVNTLNPLHRTYTHMKLAQEHLRNALTALQQTLDLLTSASNYATWDTFLGGGLFVDSIKHSRMADARNTLQQAFYALQMARNEYPELPPIRGAMIEDTSFLWDGFFDNIFTDWQSMNRIHQSQNSVQETYIDAQNVFSWLENKLVTVDQQYTALNTQLTLVRKRLHEERKRMITDAIKT